MLTAISTTTRAEEPLKVFVEDVSIIGFPKKSERNVKLMGQALASDIQNILARSPHYLPMTFENLQSQLRKEKRLEKLQCERSNQQCVLQILDNFGCSERVFGVVRFMDSQVQVSMTRMSGNEMVQGGARSAYTDNKLSEISRTAQELAAELFELQLVKGGSEAQAGAGSQSGSSAGEQSADVKVTSLVKQEPVTVPAGSFIMGSNSGERMERPAHRTTLGAFTIDKYEVTQSHYLKFVKDTGRIPPSCGWEPEGRYANHPVVCVTWHDAEAYCRWRGQRLPTEAEWEMAARGPDSRLFPWGEMPATCQLAIMDDGAQGCGAKFAQAVGSRKRGQSPCGAMDMAGNVWEWVADWFDEHYYDSWRMPKENPQGPADGTLKVARGGSWGDSMARYLRPSKRNRKAPTESSKYYGFRCAGSIK